MASKSKDLWRVLRCAFHYKSRVTEDLESQGFEIHDSYLNTGSVREAEEYVIVAKRVVV
jgi:TolB-like protein